LAQGENGI